MDDLCVQEIPEWSLKTVIGRSNFAGDEGTVVAEKSTDDQNDRNSKIDVNLSAKDWAKGGGSRLGTEVTVGVSFLIGIFLRIAVREIHD
jgi:hypothetical protein